MLDLERIRQEPERVREAAHRKGETVDLDQLVRLDQQHREIVRQVEQLRHRRNAASKDVAARRKSGEDAGALMTEVRKIGKEIKALEEQLRETESRLKDELLLVPNIPTDDTPVGQGPDDNVEVRSWGERRTFDFEPKPHWDIGQDLGILDFERATKVAGPHFALYLGQGAQLERALFNFMIDLHTREHGYKEVFPPFLANRAACISTGQLPKLEEDMYLCTKEDLFLIPTAEVPVTNLHRDEIIPGAQLPIAYTAYTACFRSEAGSYGKDTRGLMRVHQFDKVELVKFVRPETSYDELEKLLGHAEAALRALDLEYRVLQLCTGELSFASAKCYDIELWAPGIRRYLEVSSCSNFEDFQARRANIRFKDKGGKPQFVHTLNGSGVALARLVVALLETYQNEDGTVTVPEPLRPYLHGRERLEKES